MRIMKSNILNIILFACIAVSCNQPDLTGIKENGSYPEIFPDYTGVTIPADIAPLNFMISDRCDKALVLISGRTSKIEVKASDNKVIIPSDKWEQLLHDNAGGSFKVEVSESTNGQWTRFSPFTIFVSKDTIDGYLVYRNLIPGFQNWNRMGIYQRSLAGFDVETIIDSRLLPGTCMNCHSFALNNPHNMVLHLRESYGGTILRTGGHLEKLNTRTEKMFASAAFPYWHPSGRFIVFSVNRVNQIFHATGPYRATALDLKSDIVLYNIEKHEMIIPPGLSRDDKFETFPCFSPDGKTLYYCSADSLRMPAGFDSVKYSLCSVSFDEKTGEFPGETDTLISSSETGKSYSIPRVSPDGKYLMFNVTDFGAFPSYNPEADLWLMDLEDKKYYPLDSLNSSDVESYHSWSSESRWVVFSSRRMDGLFSNLYIAYIDENGIGRKPFLLPQKDPAFHKTFLFSFNVPEFVIKPVGINPYQIERTAKSNPSVQVQSGSSH